MSYEIPPCSVCNELESGLYNCKICALAYCSEHLCLHLNVAWETNTWTTRNLNTIEDQINYEIQNSPNVLSTKTLENNSSLVRETEYQDQLQNNAKTLLSYTEAQLQAQLEFYNAQARRIRRELERRSIPFQSFGQTSTFRSRNSLSSKPRIVRKNQNNSASRKFSSTTTKAIDVLSDYLREGRISLEYLKSQLNIGVSDD